MSAASQVRRLAPDWEVVVLEATRDVSYGACGMPYKLAPGGSMADLQVISARRFRSERGIDVRLEHRVERLDPGAHVVHGAAPSGHFALTYDRLILATGASAVRPDISGLAEQWGERAFTLKTLADGRALKAALESEPAPRRVVVVGGGYIGLEAAEGLRAAGLEVTVVEAQPQLVPFLAPKQQERVVAEVRRRGVQLQLDTRVVAVHPDGAGALRVATSGPELRADLILVAVGVRPNSALASTAGIRLGARGSVAVDEHLRTSASDIFAAGDCADATDALTGASTWVPLALRANRAGKLAGANAVGVTRAAPPVLGTAVFKVFDLQVARTGLTTAEQAEAAGFDPASRLVGVGTRAHYHPGGGPLSVHLLADRASKRLLGGTMVGPEAAAHRIDTLAAALHARLTVAELADMDLAYAPPFGGVWSPLLLAASVLLKEL